MRRILILTAALLAAMPALARLEKINDYYYKVWGTDSSGKAEKTDTILGNIGSALDAAMSTSDKFIRLEIHADVTIPYDHDVRKKLDGQDQKYDDGLLYKHEGAIWLEAAILDGEDVNEVGQGLDARYKVTLDGGGTVRCLNLDDAKSSTTAIGGAATAGLNGNLAFSHFIGIRFKQGHADGNGGGVYCWDNACFLHCEFAYCHATGDGGAIIYPADDQYHDITQGYKNDSGVAVGDCSFSNCKADTDGGALRGGDGGGTLRTVSDCTFDTCEATSDGGAIYNWNSERDYKYLYNGSTYAWVEDYGAIRRCTFTACKAQYGGAIYIGHCILACLFKDCTATSEGGAIRSGSGSDFDTYAYCCTFINCTDPENFFAVENTGVGDCIIYNCLYYGSEHGGVDDESTCYKVENSGYFLDFNGGNYRINYNNSTIYDIDTSEPDYDEDKTKEPFSDVYNSLLDLDVRPYSKTSSTHRPKGCFSYYTKEEWDQYLYDHRPYEYNSGCDPLLVTTTADSNDHKDGVVSFREACEYYGRMSVRRKSSHQKEIKFQLPGNSPTITIKTNSFDVAKTGETLTIDGGNGITLAADNIKNWTIGFYGDSSNDKRIFKNLTLRVGLKVNSNSLKVELEFVNCAFKDDGNGNIGNVGRVGSAWDSSGAEANWKFECCTFADYTTSAYIIDSGCTGTIVTFDACTFTGISMPTSIARGVGKSITYRNCTLFDNGAPTMRKDWSDAPYTITKPPTENYYNCIICQSLYNLSGNPAPNLYNTAVSDTPGEVFNSAMPVEKTINGVVQVGFEPKHKGTARGVEPSSPYWSQVPTYDIFGNTNPSSRYASQGSYFVNDKEDPSLLVNDPGDYSDEFDDKITLREAIVYAANPANRHIIAGATIRPIFDEAAFPDGNVVVTFDKTLRLSEDIFAAYPLELQPGNGQTLTITAPNTSDAAFRIADGLKMRVTDTTFKSCKGSGDGGAIKSYGQLLVNACRFENCEASGWGGGLYFSKTSQAFVYGTTFTGCKADIGGAIGNWGGNLVTICVTLTGNEAEIGSAVCSSDATQTLFANATIANNRATSSGGGAFSVEGENAGLINSIVAGNKNGNLAGSWSVAPPISKNPATGNFYAYSVTDGALSDIFLSANAIETNMPNGVTQLYYPLNSSPANPAKKGAFVFVRGGLDQNGKVEGSWPERVGYSTDIDGFSPNLPRELNGLEMGNDYGPDFNGYASRDLTGALIMPKDTGMGAVPSFAADVIDASSLVNTLEDVVSDTDGQVSLREAVDYAMAHGGQVNFAPSIFAGADPVFRLDKQIVVPEGCSFELKAPNGHGITLVATATDGNRFFWVEPGGALKLEGITLGRGTAHGIYGIMSPTDDANGGAVCGVGKRSDLAFVNCAFFDNQAPKGFGGAIYAEGLLSLTDCVFIGNSAGHDGGAVYSKAAMMTMTGGEVSGNSAGMNGGGIGILAGNATNIVKNVTITGNEAGERGGGVYSGDGQTLGYVLLQDVTATGNRADATLSVDPNVFTGAGYTFNEQYVLRVNRKYYEVKKDEMGVERVELSEEAAPVLGAIDLGSVATSGKAMITVSNVIPGLEYGLGHAETPAGPYEVDKWERATSEADLYLEAPAAGAGGFYRVMAREAQ